MEMVSPVEALTTSGPVTNMFEFSRVMMMRSVRPGSRRHRRRRAENQAQLGHEAAGLASLAEDATVLGQGGHASWMRAPPESTMATIGTLRSMAMSISRQIFSPSAVPRVPPLTEKSCA